MIGHLSRPCFTKGEYAFIVYTSQPMSISALLILDRFVCRRRILSARNRSESRSWGGVHCNLAVIAVCSRIQC